MRLFAFVVVSVALATFIAAAPSNSDLLGTGDHLASAAPETHLPNTDTSPSADPSSLTPGPASEGATTEADPQLKSLPGRALRVGHVLRRQGVSEESGTGGLLGGLPGLSELGSL